MVNYKSEFVNENILNNTICVKTKAGIRSMRFREDIEADLVWIDQVVPEELKCESGICAIMRGQYARYVDIYVSPRSNEFLR